MRLTQPGCCTQVGEEGGLHAASGERMAMG
jgi:hypothetical protein